MPGTQWKKRVVESRKIYNDMVELPYRWVKKQMVRLVVSKVRRILTVTIPGYSRQGRRA